MCSLTFKKIFVETPRWGVSIRPLAIRRDTKAHRIPLCVIPSEPFASAKDRRSDPRDLVSGRLGPLLAKNEILR
jgi:hypothetical protein